MLCSVANSLPPFAPAILCTSLWFAQRVFAKRGWNRQQETSWPCTACGSRKHGSKATQLPTETREALDTEPIKHSISEFQHFSNHAGRHAFGVEPAQNGWNGMDFQEVQKLQSQTLRSKRITVTAARVACLAPQRCRPVRGPVKPLLSHSPTGSIYIVPEILVPAKWSKPATPGEFPQFSETAIGREKKTSWDAINSMLVQSLLRLSNLKWQTTNIKYKLNCLERPTFGILIAFWCTIFRKYNIYYWHWPFKPISLLRPRNTVWNSDSCVKKINNVSKFGWTKINSLASMVFLSDCLPWQSTLRIHWSCLLRQESHRWCSQCLRSSLCPNTSVVTFESLGYQIAIQAGWKNKKSAGSRVVKIQ